MRDVQARVIYAGKALSLRNRVPNYFQASSVLPEHIAAMVARVYEFEGITTATDKERVVLEQTMIKRHRPRFNIRLRDDKNYLYIKLPLNEDFPRITLEIFVQGQLDVEIVLVIAQPDVEAGAMPLDHRLLQDERLFLGRRGDHLELIDPRDHGGDVLRQHARGLDGTWHAVAQGQRLAGVDHPRLDVAHQVDARRVGQRLETLF